MKKLALLFFGFHYQIYRHWYHKKNVLVDFRKSIENYQEYIFKYFKNEGFEIDVFFSTYDSEILPELIETYQPKKYSVLKNIISNRFISRNTHFRNSLKLVIDYQKENKTIYDNILITRFDLLYQIPFSNTKKPINYNKLNLISHLNPYKIIDDNFYLIPQKYLNSLYRVSFYDKSFHFLEKKFRKKMGFEIIFINEEGPIHILDLSFYKFVRNIL